MRAEYEPGTILGTRDNERVGFPPGVYILMAINTKDSEYYRVVKGANVYRIKKNKKG